MNNYKPSDHQVAPLRVRVLVALLAPASLTVATPSAAGDPINPGSITAVAEFIEDYLASDLPAASPSAVLSIPPHVPANDIAAWKMLRSAVDRLTIFAPPHGRKPIGPGAPDPARARAHMANSLRHEETALESLLVLEPRRADAFSELVAAASDLEKALQLADRITAVSVRVALDDLSIVGEQFALEAVRRAELAGLPAPLVESALAVVSDGAELAGDGRVEEGFDTWHSVFLLGEFPVFSMDLFEQNILDALDLQSVGYAYVLSRNGQEERSDGIGLARLLQDPPLTPQSPDKEMNIASISKTLTATAVLRLLEARNLDADDLISPFLPPTWTQGNGVDELTFRHLLTHRSGLNNNDPNQPVDYFAMETTILNGVNASQTFQYQNANFTLFPVMLPYLWGLKQETIDAFGATPDVATAAIYITFMRLAILQPAGATGSCAPTDLTPTLYYRFPDDGLPGIETWDWTLVCAGGGWRFTTRDLAAVMAARRFDNSVLSPAARFDMDMNFYGWMSPVDYSWGNGAWGVYRNHGGDLFFADTNPHEMHSCAMDFPLGVQAVLIINSARGAIPYQCELLQDAFDGAWTYP